ncbi:hypothetical protein D0T66_06200 [Dysgonomonas sp. 25]|nr:hypothetical protein [Dysgonomonas sp. 25]
MFSYELLRASHSYKLQEKVTRQKTSKRSILVLLFIVTSNGGEKSLQKCKRDTSVNFGMTKKHPHGEVEKSQKVIR